LIPDTIDSGSQMPRKPANLQYGVDDTPPVTVVMLNALQYVAVLTGFLVFPLIMTREAHASTAVTESVLSWSMIVLAIGTILQALPKGPVGSGLLAPSVMTAVYVGPSLEAVRLGGLALMSGMTLFGGAAEALLSRSMHRLRFLLPPELAGVVILLVAIGNGMVGYRSLLTPGDATPGWRHWTVAATTMLVTLILNVWGKGVARTSCALLGMVAGYAVAIPLGLVGGGAWAGLSALPPLQLPRVDYFTWSFSAVLIVPFLIAALANTLKAAALLTAAERFADADWVRPDLQRIGKGVLADGITTALSGGLCVFGVNVSAASVGLTEASGVASRVVAYGIGGIFALLAFIPALLHLFTLMPAPVIGATFIFTSCAIIKGGIETIASRMLDARRTLVVGLALLSGLAAEAFPSFVLELPKTIQPLLGSSLVMGTMVGFVLNAVFRIGSRRRETLSINPSAIDMGGIQDFMEGRGGAWGARREAVTRATFAAHQMAETIADTCEPEGSIELTGSFDEFDLVVEARYKGALLALPERRPTPDEILHDEDGARRLAGFMLRHNADRASSVRRGDICVVRFQFQH
jgi:xanthine permease XanP